jgi:hypothetical protein
MRGIAFDLLAQVSDVKLEDIDDALLILIPRFRVGM